MNAILKVKTDKLDSFYCNYDSTSNNLSYSTK